MGMRCGTILEVDGKCSCLLTKRNPHVSSMPDSMSHSLCHISELLGCHSPPLMGEEGEAGCPLPDVLHFPCLSSPVPDLLPFICFHSLSGVISYQRMIDPVLLLVFLPRVRSFENTPRNVI